ncbi:hypothetical protein F2P56_021746 [Juglans regia]|uniref:UDP-glycosyltransferase 83A1-like n=2 Tax=Juglans regia TaxID=51240 RepID=A0A833X9X7_JUGRE|nr:UDP-glycosyltransferase 83A1-like [Juglans regia]KAF5457660.1 hypothetical protein F2P56_021746 [Juglans regia]
MGRGRILALPYPAQGHVSPMMAFCRVLEKHGFKITFVNTDFNHKRIVRAGVGKDSLSMGSNNINFVSIPDGLDPEDERNELEFPKLCQSMLLTMPAKLEELVRGINSNAAAASGGRGGLAGGTDDDDDDKITCFITEFGMSWALEVADKMGIKGAAYYPMCTTFCNATSFFAPNKELEAFLNSDGIKGCGTDQLPEEVQKILSLPTGDLDTLKIIFEYSARNLKAMEKTEWWLCNSAYELEPDEFAKVPRLLPIGPNLAEISGSSRAQFFQEDSSCLEWLDQQPPCSVIYVAFGSVATFEPTQFQELALGLDLTNRPFLWVVRPNIINSSSCAFPDEFKGTRGKIVTWAPQPRVLNHPSIACFLSHCGWNSTIEGLSSAVPFLCWPFFADQITNKMCICDVWKVGVGFDPDDNHGIIRRSEIKKKVDLLFGDDNIRARSSQLRDTVLSTTAEGGRSSKNLNKFINWLRE